MEKTIKPQYLFDSDPWMLGEDIPNCDLFFSTIWLNGFVSYFDRHTGRAFQKILCKYEGYHLWFYFGEKDSYEVGEHLANRIISEPGYATEVNKNIIIESDKLRAFSETIPQSDLGKLSDAELWAIYKKHQEIHSEYYTWGWIPVAVDMFHGNLTKHVKKYLAKKGVSEDKLNEYFVILTQPTKKSLIFVEQEDLLKIAMEIQKSGKRLEDIGDIKDIIEEHRQKYYYTKHIWVSGEYTIDDYKKQLEEILNEGEPAEIILQKQYQELEKTKEKRKKLMTELEIEPEWRIVLDAFGDFMVTKIYRRYAQLLAVHHMSTVLKEIARRKFLTEKQVRFATFAEVEKMLLEDSYDANELLKRTKLCVYYAEKGFEKVYIKQEAEDIIKKIEVEIKTDITELRGDTACVGYAKGAVKIVIRAEDMAKMNQGDVLVSIATDPDIVPAMKKASAIVTEQGGVTSHAAIVSRELGIPCVIGTKIATRVLKDGDMVEVDAGRGIVRKIT